MYSICTVTICGLEVLSVNKKGWQFWLGEDTVAELDVYAKEWGMNRSAALTMIIKSVAGGKQIVNPPETKKSDDVSGGVLSET